MKWNKMLALIFAAVLLTGDVVLAKGIDCTGGECVGTKHSDFIVGTAGHDEIEGRGSLDQIFSDVSNGPAANDTVRGGGDIVND